MIHFHAVYPDPTRSLLSAAQASAQGMLNCRRAIVQKLGPRLPLFDHHVALTTFTRRRSGTTEGVKTPNLQRQDCYTTICVTITGRPNLLADKREINFTKARNLANVLEMTRIRPNRNMV